MAENLQTTPQACGASSCAPSPASAPESSGIISAPVAAPVWGSWTLASELNAEQAVQGMRWAVQGLIPMGSVALLYGAAYSGKTGLAVHLASCLVSGTSFFGRAVEPMPCFYLALENIQDVQAHVLAVQQAKGAGWRWPRLLALTDKATDLGRRGDADHIATDIRRMAGERPAALIVDALLDGVGDRDITSNVELWPVMRNVHIIAESIRGPVILVHHANRTAERTVLGASVILTRADTHIRVEETKGGSIWTAEKVKGGVRQPAESFAFRAVPLGRNGAGQDVSSCVLVEQGPVKTKAKATSGQTATRTGSTASASSPAPSSAPAPRLPRRL